MASLNTLSSPSTTRTSRVPIVARASRPRMRSDSEFSLSVVRTLAKGPCHGDRIERSSPGNENDTVAGIVMMMHDQRTRQQAQTPPNTWGGTTTVSGLDPRIAPRSASRRIADRCSSRGHGDRGVAITMDKIMTIGMDDSIKREPPGDPAYWNGHHLRARAWNPILVPGKLFPAAQSTDKPMQEGSETPTLTRGQ